MSPDILYKNVINHINSLIINILYRKIKDAYLLVYNCLYSQIDFNIMYFYLYNIVI